jgi:hypothetical protein
MGRFGGMSQTMEVGFGSRLEQHGTYAGNRQTKVYLMMGPRADPANLPKTMSPLGLGTRSTAGTRRGHRRCSGEPQPGGTVSRGRPVEIIFSLPPWHC